MAKILIEMSSADLKKAIREWFVQHVNFTVQDEDVIIEVQSKQNYRVHEWEKGDFRARLEKLVP